LNWIQTITNFVTVLVFAPIILALSITGTTTATMLFDKDYTLEEEIEELQEAVMEEEGPEGNEVDDEVAEQEPAEQTDDPDEYVETEVEGAVTTIDKAIQ